MPRLSDIARSCLLLWLLRAACAGAESFSLSWDYPAGDVGGFKIERSDDGGNFAEIAVVSAATLTYVDTTISREVEYSYRIRAFNLAGNSDYSKPVTAELTSRMTNVSVRTPDVSDSLPLTVGFVIVGAAEKTILVRGIGPTLEAFGLPKTLDDPVLSLYSGPTLLKANDDWDAGPDFPETASRSLEVGAFPLLPGSHDSAVTATVKSGASLVQLQGKGTSHGMAMLELYDLKPQADSRLVNVSAMTRIGAEDDAAIIGLVIAGNVPKRILVRVIGPSLAAFGVTGFIATPQVALYRADSPIDRPFLEAREWGGGNALKAAFEAAAAFALPDTSGDAAVLTTLTAGAYTLKISGVGTSAGYALIELYEVP